VVVVGPILSSFIYIFCVVITADIIFIDYHFSFYDSYVSLII